jgi:thiol-disulfide isomerase/thioredoxin
MPKSNKTVVVFHMSGCHACADYMPRFRRVAVKYRPFVAIKTANISLAAGGKAADEYKIKAAPTTCILAADGKILKKVEGSIAVAEIEKIFRAAIEG